MREFEERIEVGKDGKVAKIPPKMPNQDRNPSKEKGPVREPIRGEPMILTPEGEVGVKGNPTSTDVAAGKTRTSTVTDGEDG